MPRGILPEVKLQAVKDYISGNGSYYHTPADLEWVKPFLEDGLTSIKHSENPFSSEQFGISYQQARNYTIKYEKQREEAFRDRRGKWKPESEMSELEKLRAEKEHAQMEAQKNLRKSKGGGAEP